MEPSQRPIPAKRRNLPKSPPKDNTTLQTKGSFFGRPPPPVPVKRDMAPDVLDCEYAELPDTEPIDNISDIPEQPTKEKKKDKKLISLFKSQNNIPLAKSDTRRYTKKKEKHSKPAPVNPVVTAVPKIKEEVSNFAGEVYEVLPDDIEVHQTTPNESTLNPSVKGNIKETTASDNITQHSENSTNNLFNQRKGMKMLDINTQALRNVKLKPKPTTADVFNRTSSKEDENSRFKNTSFQLPKLKSRVNVDIKDPSSAVTGGGQENTHNSGVLEHQSSLNESRNETSLTCNKESPKTISSPTNDLPARTCLVNDKPSPASRNIFNRPPPPVPPVSEEGEVLPDPSKNTFYRPPPPIPSDSEDSEVNDLEYTELPDGNQPSRSISNGDDENQPQEVNSNSLAPQSCRNCGSNNNASPEQTNSTEVRGAGEHTNLSEDIKALDTNKWFHGSISRNEADSKILGTGQNGHFLVRKSVKGGLSNPYTLCLNLNGDVKNLHIRLRNDKKYAIGVEKTDEVTFSTVPEMISYHQKNAIIIGGNNEEIVENVILMAD